MASHTQNLDPVCHIVTPVGMLGYGLDEPATRAALSSLISTGVSTALILDSGSTDSGPSKLALGEMSCQRSAYTRDLSKLLKLVHDFKIPLLFSSAGGAGTDDQVEEIVKVIEEIAAEEGNEHYDLRTVAIYAGIDKTTVLERLEAGEITPCGASVPKLTEKDVTASRCIVAQMGPQPFLDAMRDYPDFNLIVGGRAYDPSPYVAYAAHVSGVPLDDWSSKELRLQVGGFTHMGKIMECGGVCAIPKSQGAIATVYRNGTFDIAPLDSNARCTPVSVAAHALYENSRPTILIGPGGYLELTGVNYEQLPDGRTVRVHGAMFHWGREKQIGVPYQVKLEAARVVGYRAMYMGSIKDPILIRQLDSLLERVRLYVAEQHKDAQGPWELEFHKYGGPGGTNGTDNSDAPVPEVFLIGEVLASSQELATSLASTAKVATTHGSYAGQKATAGNFAFGIGGLMTIPCGPCAEFCIYHVMNLGDGEEGLHGSSRLFSSKKMTIGKQQPTPTPTPPPATETTTTVAKKETSKAAQAPPNPESDNYLPHGTLGKFASVVRSKNAGPYEVTFDVMFDSENQYNLIKESGIFSLETVADILGVSNERDIVWCGFFDPARAFKVTIPRKAMRGGGGRRRLTSGGYMEQDVHAAQQHVPLMYMKLPGELVDRLARVR
ncbi:hypothetical protein GGS20DRAFT_581409 [Poronia punctata]|nr:hypothetical protein GGS20DRAFT_581409 [Poronia punctata]